MCFAQCTNVLLDSRQNGQSMSIRTCGHNNDLQCALLPLFTVGHYNAGAQCQSMTVLVSFLFSYQKAVCFKILKIRHAYINKLSKPCNVYSNSYLTLKAQWELYSSDDKFCV